MTRKVEAGSMWRKNANGVWKRRNDENYEIRVEWITPLGNVVLRRMDCEHEFVWPVATLLAACDEIGS